MPPDMPLTAQIAFLQHELVQLATTVEAAATDTNQTFALLDRLAYLQAILTTLLRLQADAPPAPPDVPLPP